MIWMADKRKSKPVPAHHTLAAHWLVLAAALILVGTPAAASAPQDTTPIPSLADCNAQTLERPAPPSEEQHSPGSLQPKNRQHQQSTAAQLGRRRGKERLLAEASPLRLGRHAEHRGGSHTRQQMLWDNPWLQEALYLYEERHKAFLRDPETADGFVVAYTGSGSDLGNRLPAVVAGFVLALLTDRVFLMDLGAFRPYLGTRTVDMDFQKHKDAVQRRAGSDRATWLGHTEWHDHMQNFLEVNLTTAYASSPVLAIRTDDYPAGLLLANPHHAPLLRRLFPSGEVFHALSRYLFSPAAALQRSLARFTQANFQELTIGIHLWQYNPFRGNVAPAPESYVALAQSLITRRGMRPEQVAVFLEADNPDDRRKLAALFQQQLGIAVASHPAHPALDENDAAGLQQIVLDLFTFAECDEVIATAGSMFGSVAAGLAGVPPLYLLHGEPNGGWPMLNPWRNPWYRGAVSSEPCMFRMLHLLRHWNGQPDLLQRLMETPFWLQHTQCHPCAGCGEEEQVAQKAPGLLPLDWRGVP